MRQSVPAIKKKQQSIRRIKRQISKYYWYRRKLTYSDTYAQENVTIDMEKVDIKALQAISGMKLSENADKNISMKQMQTVMESAGFKEVK